MARDLSGIAPVIPIDRLDTLPAAPSDLRRVPCRNSAWQFAAWTTSTFQQGLGGRSRSIPFSGPRRLCTVAFRRLLRKSSRIVGNLRFGIIAGPTPTRVQDHGQPRGGSRCLFPAFLVITAIRNCSLATWLGTLRSAAGKLDHFLSVRGRRCWLNTGRRPRLRAIHHNDPMGLDRPRDAICSYLRTARAGRMRPVANHDRIGIATGSGNHGEGATGSWRPGVDRRAGLPACTVGSAWGRLPNCLGPGRRRRHQCVCRG